MIQQTYYEILEISPNAPQHEIHQAYQRAKQTYSADGAALYSMFSPDEAKQLLALIEEAYAILSSHAKRRDYDLQLMSQGGSLKSFTAPTKVENKPVQNAKPKEEPKGSTQGKTRIGTYPISDEMEQQITAATEIDGSFFQRVREYKRISIEQLAEYTKISKTYWNALEKNDFKALPAPVFVRGYVAQLARLLGLDDKAVTEHYMKYFKSQNVER